MNKYIKAKPALFFTGILLGIILLIYFFTATHFTSDTNNADNKNYSAAAGAGQEFTLSAENEESAESKNSVDYNEKRLAVLAQENDELYAASRGDIERYLASSGTAEKTSDKPASTGTAPAPAKTDAQPGKSAGAPAAAAADAPTAPGKTEAPVPAVQNAPAVKSAPAAESEDLDLLARLITAEAQGEPFEAQVAVGAVVMNRVKSSDWPNTIKGVIYQKIGEYYQFTPVVNGWIDKPAEPEAIKAAKAAMNGSDPTNGAQFYYDDKCTNEWILAKPVALRAGHMIFAY